METLQLPAEQFREMNPLLDNNVMLSKMLAFVISLFATQQMEQKAHIHVFLTLYFTAL